MPLSIQNSKAERLARQVATPSGETIAQAIIHALKERLERMRGRRTAGDMVAEILKISKRCSQLPD
jgi:antitoxin VapB